MSKLNRIIAVVLVAILMVTATNIKCLADESGNETFVYNGEEYEILSDNDKEFVIEGEDSDYEYESSYDKDTNEINIVCNEKKLFFDEEVANYKIDVISYDETNNILEYDIYNNETGEVVHISDSDIQPQFPIVAGIAIGEIVKCLLVTCAVVCVYEGVKYVAVSISELRKKNYYCYTAYLYKGSVVIGPALTYKEAVAYAKSTKNIEKVGVFCFGSDAKSKAKKIAKAAGSDGKVAHHDVHDNSEGYYKHYHPLRSSGNTYHFHSWYLVD